MDKSKPSQQERNKTTDGPSPSITTTVTQDATKGLEKMRSFSQTFECELNVSDEDDGEVKLEVGMVYNNARAKHMTIYLSNQQRKELIEILQAMEPK